MWWLWRAAIAQLGERQTEDLKVPGSIPGGGIFLCQKLFFFKCQKTQDTSSGDRTHDHKIKSLALYHLSYGGDLISLRKMIGWPSGLRRQFKALVSSGARVRISSQSLFFILLGEKQIKMQKKGAKGDSNPRPLAPKARIIPLDHWPEYTEGIWTPNYYRCA